MGLHQWQLKGYETPRGLQYAEFPVFECKRCGFALISQSSEPIAKQLQKLINENQRLVKCEEVNAWQTESETQSETRKAEIKPNCD